MAVDPATGDILIAGNGTGRVYRHDGSAWDSGLPVPTAETNPRGVAVYSFGRATPILAYLQASAGAIDPQLRAEVTQPSTLAYLQAEAGPVEGQLRAIPGQITSAYLQVETGPVDGQLRAAVTQAPPSVVFAYLRSESGAPDPQLRAEVTQAPPALALTDFDVTGYDTPIVLAVITASVNGEDLTADPMTVTDGEVEVASDLTLTMVQWRDTEGSFGWIRLRRTGSGRFDTYFAPSGTYPNTDLIIQTTAESRTVLPIGGAFGGGANWVVADAAGTALIDGISTGDQFIIAIAEPARIAAHLQTESGAADGQLRAEATQRASAYLRSESGAADGQLRAVPNSPVIAHLQSESGAATTQLQALDAAATTQTITIPAATLTQDTATAKQWRLDAADAVPIVSGLLPDDTTVVLRRIVVRASGGAVIEVRLFFAVDGSAPFGLPGDDLSAQWEIAAPEAVTFEQGAAAVSIPGPGHESNTAEDIEDTYIWTPSPANLVLLTAFFNTDLDTAADLTLKLSNALDPAAPRTLAHLRSEGGILDPQLRAVSSSPTLAYLRSEFGIMDGQLRLWLRSRWHPPICDPGRVRSLHSCGPCSTRSPSPISKLRPVSPTRSCGLCPTRSPSLICNPSSGSSTGSYAPSQPKRRPPPDTATF